VTGKTLDLLTGETEIPQTQRFGVRHTLLHHVLRQQQQQDQIARSPHNQLSEALMKLWKDVFANANPKLQQDL